MAVNRAVLIGHDASSFVAFNMVKQELESRGWKVDAFLARGKGFKDSSEVINAIPYASFVLLGMSAPASNAAVEIEAAKVAIAERVQYGFYADTFGAHQREWFQPYRDEAVFLFVINEEEKESAQALYPRARIVVTGNHEWGEASFPKYSRTEIRSRLGVFDDEKLILLAGHKENPITAFLFMAAVHAAHGLQFIRSEGRWHVILSTHFGDKTPPVLYETPMLYTQYPVRVITAKNRYERWYNEEKKQYEIAEREGGYTTPELMPGADLLLESASTFCGTAAIQRIPIISVLTEPSKIRNAAVFGSKEWKPVVQGVAQEVYGDCSQLILTMNDLLFHPEKRFSLHALQKSLYPGISHPNGFERAIADAFERFKN